MISARQNSYYFLIVDATRTVYRPIVKKNLVDNLEGRISLAGTICERTSRLFGYCGFEDYLSKNLTETWKHLELIEDYEPQVSKNTQKNCGFWKLQYENAAVIHEKWKEAIDFYRGGKLTGISAMRIHTMKDENGRSDNLFQCIYFYLNSEDDVLMAVGKNVLHHMGHSDNSGCIRYEYGTYNTKLSVPKIDDSFKKGKILLQIQRRFVSKFHARILTAKINKDLDSSTLATIHLLEQWHKELTEMYELHYNKLHDYSKEYENESTSEERRLELSEEVAEMDYEYMKKTYDPLHLKMHCKINDTLKLLFGEFSYAGTRTPSDPFKNTFDEEECSIKHMQSRFWCLDCTYLQDMCEKCGYAYFRNEASAKASPSPCEQQYQKDKLNEMKQRKKAKKERAENKVKSVIVKENQENPYDMEKVLEALGEVNYYLYLIF